MSRGAPGPVRAGRGGRLRRLLFAVPLTLSLLLVPLLRPAPAAAAGGVVVASLRWALAVQSGRVAVLEMLTVANTGDRPTAEWSWRLPEGVQEATLQAVETGARLRAGSLGDVRPLAPGEERSYTLRYRLPQRVPARLSFVPSLPVENASALVDEGSLRLAGPGWIRLGVVSLGDRALRQYAFSAPVPAGRRLELLLTPPDWWYEHGTGALAVLWALELAALPAAAAAFWRRSRPERELERLRAALERLESRYRQGRLEETAYRLRRQQLVEEAARLLPELGEGREETG
ncbi:MAG: hypothetical protein K6U79_05340 [Firmicutes bacterium]|nr:hypothetical protein [Bacillota bacterium]